MAAAFVVAAAVFFPVALACAQDAPAKGSTIRLAVEARGELPGFDMADTPQYLVSKMLDAGVEGWAFVPVQDAGPHAPNRVEWQFVLNPYASGNVRQIVPIPAVRRLFGNRHLVSVETTLYIGDQYQTQTAGQVAIGGGDRDPDLANFIMQQTENILGQNGAYRSIDMSAPAKSGAHQGHNP
jgi:hypothetical protein